MNNEQEIIELGIVGIKNMGEYSQETEYEKLNVVTYQGSTYCALRDTVGNLPTNTDYWQLYAQKGDTGPQGDTGPEGPEGPQGNPGGAPLAASSTSEMTDTSRIYVNTTDGNWYYYDGDSWEIGGVYQASVNVDYDDYISISEYYPLSYHGRLTYHGDPNVGNRNQDGAYRADENFRCTDYIPTIYNKLIINGYLRNGNNYYVCFYDTGKNFVAQATINTSATTHDITIPDDAYYVRIYCRVDDSSTLEYQFCIQALNKKQIEVGHYIILSEAYPFLANTGYLKDNGTMATDSQTFATSDYIPVVSNKITVLGTLATSFALGNYVMFYDKNKSFISKGTVDISLTTNEVTIPDNAFYVRICNHKEMALSYFTKIEYNVDKLKYLNDYTTSEKALVTRNTNMILNKMFTAFTKFGVVGDSLSVGYYTNSSGETIGRNLPNSWPQKICDNYNMKWISFGFSGATSASWLTNTTYGQTKLRDTTNNLCQCYIIGLGANDTFSGTIADIDTEDYTNNADSFYGNYGKIIQIIQEVAPKAKIFTLTLPHPRETNNKSRAIREISTLLGVTCVDLVANYNELFSSDIIYNNYYNYHFTPAGYSNVAELMMYCLSDTMYTNRTQYYDIPEIPYSN